MLCSVWIQLSILKHLFSGIRSNNLEDSLMMSWFSVRLFKIHYLFVWEFRAYI